MMQFKDITPVIYAPKKNQSQHKTQIFCSKVRTKKDERTLKVHMQVNIMTIRFKTRC